jgi:Asp-tRNA(Asn)/Glu-tRNA(Gln) amidotransferase B subunit
MYQLTGDAERLVDLLQLVEKGISLKVARDFLTFQQREAPEQIVQEKGLTQVPTSELDKIIDEVLTKESDAGGAVQGREAASAGFSGRAGDEGQRRQGESGQGE